MPGFLYLPSYVRLRALLLLERTSYQPLSLADTTCWLTPLTGSNQSALLQDVRHFEQLIVLLFYINPDFSFFK